MNKRVFAVVGFGKFACWRRGAPSPRFLHRVTPTFIQGHSVHRRNGDDGHITGARASVLLMTDRRRRQQQQQQRAGLGLSHTGLAWNRSHRLAERLPGNALRASRCLFFLHQRAASRTRPSIRAGASLAAGCGCSSALPVMLLDITSASLHIESYLNRNLHYKPHPAWYY